jgi:hypothetical protein
MTAACRTSPGTPASGHADDRHPDLDIRQMPQPQPLDAERGGKGV